MSRSTSSERHAWGPAPHLGCWNTSAPVLGPRLRHRTKNRAARLDRSSMCDGGGPHSRHVRRSWLYSDSPGSRGQPSASSAMTQPSDQTSRRESHGAARSTSGARYLRRGCDGAARRGDGSPRALRGERPGHGSDSRQAERARRRHQRDCTYEIAPVEEHRSSVASERQEPKSISVTSVHSANTIVSSPPDPCVGCRSTTFCGLMSACTICSARSSSRPRRSWRAHAAMKPKGKGRRPRTFCSTYRSGPYSGSARHCCPLKLTEPSSRGKMP